MLVLRNQFEPLVGIDSSGVLHPLAAKSWRVNKDSTQIDFEIDTSRRFSDGTSLTAEDFKRSWEGAAAIEPISHNSSLLDVLYKIDGYDAFRKTGTISGIAAVSENHLTIRFSSPFRLGLTHLSGTRFSAYKKIGNRYIGTGPLTISEASDKTILFKPNPYRGLDVHFGIELREVPTENTLSEFSEDRLDALSIGLGDYVSDSLLSCRFCDVIPGPDSFHSIISINAENRRVFSNPNLRLAIQYIFSNALSNNPSLLGNPNLTRVDPQVFLPFQQGRLNPREAATLITRGRAFIKDLVDISHKHPLVVRVAENRQWIIKILRDHNVSLSESSGIITPNELSDLINRGGDYDLLTGGFSVVVGDPDGLYHALGKHGAIMSPGEFRERVAALLETGRNLTALDEIDPFYKKVTRAVLEDVPFVHLGFRKMVTVVHKDRVTLKPGFSLSRHGGHFEYFHPK
jgi:ABC-type transport system substrate-binding protein